MHKIILVVVYGVLMRVFLRLIVGVKYINKEALSSSSQFVIVSNHNSHLDTMALMSALSVSQLKRTHPVAAGDYFGSSKTKAYFTRLFTNAVLIARRKSKDERSPIQIMSEQLDRGHSLILFPEGSRGEPEKLQEFKKGIGVLLARHPNITYLPVFMHGMGKVLPKGEKLLVPFDSWVVFGEPTLCASSDVDAIVEEVEAAVKKLAEKVPVPIKKEKVNSPEG